MAFCPNVSSKEWKDLVSVQGEKVSHVLWDKYKGNVPSMFYVNSDQNSAKAKSWVAERFGENALSIYETAEKIGTEKVHGYVENGLMYMWSAAEVGTEFHEGYHMVFRGMLSEDQRQGLYEEAEKNFGIPTASEIADIKKEFPKISDDNAYKAVLEEKMADEFKEYILAEGDMSLPAGIGKFFKDIWNFIKAIFSDNLSLKQTYSLISSNKMNSTLLGRGVFRNSEKFKGNNRANKITRPGFGEETIKDATDVIYTRFLLAKREKEKKGEEFLASKVLGQGENKGSVANGLLKKIYSKTDGTNVSTKEAIEVFNAEEAYLKDRSKDNLTKLRELLAKNKMIMALADDQRKRAVYKNIFNTWNDIVKVRSGNIEQEGWRTALVRKLEDAGIYITTKDKFDDQLVLPNETDDAESEDFAEQFAVIDEAQGKIYGQSSMEISPAKRLTGKVKELLSGILSSEVNSLGHKVFLDREVVFKDLLQIFSGKQTFDSMVTALKQEVKLRPHLQNVLNFMNSLEVNEKAMIFSAFALNSTEFIMLKQKIEKGTNYVEVFNPNRKDMATIVAEKWKANLVSEVPGMALYTKTVVTKEDGSIVEVLSTDQNRVLRAAKAWKEVEKLLPMRGEVNVARIDGQVNPIVEQLTQVMWELGLYIGSNTNIGDTQKALQVLADSGIDNKSGADTMRDVKNTLLSFLRVVGEFTRDPKKSELLEFKQLAPTGNQDFVSKRKSVAVELANKFKGTMSSAGISFVNGKNKAIYATNTETHMTQIVNILKEKMIDGKRSERSAEMLKMYLQDEFINVGGRPEFQSVLFKHLQNLSFLDEFNVFDFDASKLGKDNEEAMAYEDFSDADTLVTVINAFINNNTDSDYTYIAVPVQADRDKFTFVKVPRLSKNAFGMQFMAAKDLIKGQIVQDLVRVAQAKSVVKDALDQKAKGNPKYADELLEGYHTAPGDPTKITENKEYLGNAFKDAFFQFRAKNKDGGYIVTDENLKEDTDNTRINNRLQMSDKIMDYVNKSMDEESKKTLDTKLDRMANEMLGYFFDQAAALEKTIKEAKKEGDIGISGAKGVDLSGLLKGFVIENAIMRNEVVKLFRGNRALSKNQEDFYKRMGHLTTPGTKMAMKGDVGEVAWLDEGQYGMMDSFNEIAMRDVYLDLTPKQIKEANDQADNVYNGLVANGVDTTEAKQIADAYRPGNVESTNAQAFISLDMHRSIQQGLGKWERHDEEAFKAYKRTGEFVYQPGFVPEGFTEGQPIVVLPHKGYFEKMEYNNNIKTLFVDSQKNSYFVLLESYTKDSPHLEDLRQRMEAVGNYAGQSPVHVINFVSGKKMAKKGIYKHTGEMGRLGEAIVNTHKSSGLRFPQFISSPKDNPTNALNRQIKKNMVANVEDDTFYDISPKILDIPITGKDLKDIYHAAVEEKLARDMNYVNEELGLNKLKSAFDTGNLAKINEAKLEVLKSVRQKVLSQAQSKDLHSNYEKALDIVFDEEGTPRFTAPLDIPLYNKKYESIIMAVINNEVFKQKVKGFEAVQVAQLGGSEVDGGGSLKFLQIEGKRVIHAEMMIREDVARKYGIEPGQSLDEIPEELRRVVAYRIPNQDKASVVILKIVKILPANHAKAVVIPGQLLQLMGSDHDVDKLNLLFPELDIDKETGAISKTVVNYNDLIKNKDVSKLSNKQINNVILDMMEAVYTNAAHMKEVFTPLDDTSLNSIVTEIKQKNPELAADLDWSDFRTEALTARRNTLGNKLRGIYANTLAARNVLQHGNVRINNDYVIKINGVEYRDYIKESYQDPFNDKSRSYPTDKAISLFLSAAVDAAKTPVQYELNDTVLTARVRTLFAGFFPDYSSRYCSLFLNQPLVREFTDFFETRYSGDLRKVSAAYKAFSARFKKDKTAKKILDLNNLGTFNMSSDELQNLNKEGRDQSEQLRMLANFMKFYEGGKSLMQLGKRVTPDSMDGLGRIGSVQSYIDRSNKFDYREDSLKEPMFFEPKGMRNVVDQFIGIDSKYGLERGYENLLKDSLEFAGVFFPTRLSEGFLTFKSNLLEQANANEFSPEMHQLIDYNLMFMMLTKKGSPFANLLDMGALYSSPSDNIYTQLQDLKRRYPGLNMNPFVANLEQDTDTEAGYYGIKFDNTFKASGSEKQSYTDGLFNMLFNPQVYVAGDKTIDEGGKYLSKDTAIAVNEIKRMGVNLAMNTFFVNGFRQGASSYSDIVPIEFFTSPMKLTLGKPQPGVAVSDKMSVLDFFRQEANKVKDPSYFNNEDLVKYMALFGKMRAGGSNLLNRETVETFIKPEKESDAVKVLIPSQNSAFIVVKNKAGSTGVFMKTADLIDSEGSSNSEYTMLNGTFSTKKSTKIYGFGKLTNTDPLANINLADSVPAGITTYKIDRRKLPIDTGNMACSI